MQLKFRNGFPTKSSIRQIGEEVLQFGWYHLRMGGNYGKGEYSVLVFTNTMVNEKLEEICELLSNSGVNVEKTTPYNSPLVGSIIISKKQ